MKKLFVLMMVVLFMMAGGLLFAGPIEWGGSFTFRAGIVPGDYRNVDGPGDLADISADFEVQIDETNLLHTSVGATSGNKITVGDT